MAIRGTVTLECDTKGCQAETVIEAEIADMVTLRRGGIELTMFAADWRLDDDDLLHCPQCCEENPRENGDDDGREYADPRDAKAERL